MEIRVADLSDPQVLDLVRLHLHGMQTNTPADHVFALDLAGLQQPGITLWAAWRADRALGIGALKRLDAGSGEIKSMRTHPDTLRQGVGACLLEHIIDAARGAGLTRLSLETGRGPAFDPALALYRRRGFVSGPPFGAYEPSPYNQFFHLTLD
ncbi:MAG: GNAT family N-acetyltransferase [Sphingomonadales bacterium]|nr:GNAT family N-acetyltransferase [Sphingomonadales bacterium]